MKKGPSQIRGDTFSPGLNLMGTAQGLEALSLCLCISLIKIIKKEGGFSELKDYTLTSEKNWDNLTSPGKVVRLKYSLGDVNAGGL